MNTISQAQQLIQQNQSQAAYDLLARAIQQQPNFAEAYALQGQILEQNQQYSQALDHYLRASQLVPSQAEWRFSLARCVALGVDSKENILEALRFYSQLFLLYPTEYPNERAYQKYLLERLGLYVFARQDEEIASERPVNFPIEQYPTLESFYQYFNRFANIENGGTKEDNENDVIDEDPIVILQHYNDFFYRYPDCEFRGLAYTNAATSFKNLGLYDLAEKSFERAFSITPSIPPLAVMQCGMLLNMLGKYDKGFYLAEARWEQDIPGFNDVPFNFPRWKGEDLTGKKLLVVGEQGLGDAIQFARYIPILKTAGIDVVVFTKPGLFTFMKDHLAHFGIEQRRLDECHTGFDYFLPIMSLPLYFHTTVENIPYSEGYLTLSPEFSQKWKTKITPTAKRKIGFVFSGSKGHGRNTERSIPLDIFSQLFTAEAEFHCLQKEIDDEDLAVLSTFPNVFIHHHELEDFRDTAGLVEQMDLVITVDTSVAHLAGGFAKTTWILITYVPDFRWLLNREDSPWYDSVRLFRQYSNKQWQPVMQRVLAELAKLD